VSTSSLPATQNPARFFGLDLSSLWRDLRTAWRGMAQWPALAWLSPALPVRLWLPSGEQAFCRDSRHAPIDDAQRAKAARFEAVLLPESLLLRRAVDLPKLQPAELDAALALEVQALSPFAPGEALSAHEVLPHGTSALRAQLILTSRKLVDQHLAAIHPQRQSPEVWVPRAAGPGFVMLPGFGEVRRQRQSAAWRWASGLLALLALALLAAMAVTPTVQLYIRSVKANEVMASLQKKAGPVMAQRESLVRATEQLSSAAVLAGKPVPPLQALTLITESLPDDTSLLNLQIQGLKVTMSGQTANASALMKQLGGTPGLRDVKAPTPAIKPLGAPRETFTIEFTLDPASLSPAFPPKAAS
jgi:general secretion pathway protein L